MKLNYYMRGLGIGIVVTALLMGIALSGKKEKMTDEEIRQRALEMGMIDGNVALADMPEQDGEKEEKQEDSKEDSASSLSDNEIANHIAPEEGKTVGEQDPEQDLETETEKPAQNEDGETEMPGETGEEDENEDVQGEDGVTVNEIITITINSGDGSRVVANKLLQAGLVDDAAVFDDFLCRNGYDKRLKTGRHDIPAGASHEDIAEAVTQKGY